MAADMTNETIAQYRERIGVSPTFCTKVTLR